MLRGGEPSLIEATAQSYMSSDVVCVSPDCGVDTLLQDLATCGISCVLVCDDDRPVGIITERDVVRLAAGRAANSTPFSQTAGELMTSPVASVQSSDSIENSVALVLGGKIRHLPVVGPDGRVVGILTQTDLLRAQREQLRATSESS